MEPKDPQYRERVAGIVAGARFMQALGVELVDVGPGWCATRLPVRQDHWQQDAYVHAGVQGSIADHTAGCAAFSLVAADEIILTVEYKVNLLRPAVGEMLFCRADVLRPGRTLMVAESTVHAGPDRAAPMVSKATVTMAVTAAR